MEAEESGEQEEDDDEFMSDPEQPKGEDEKESIDEDLDDDVGDDIDTNIEGKREKAISDLLKKEDLGLI